MSQSSHIPKTQTAATVPELGKAIVFDDNYPVPTPGEKEVLVKVLYSGVCQSDLHTARGTAPSAGDFPKRDVKLPHVGGHEGVGRIVALGPNTVASAGVTIGTLVGIRFIAQVCHQCEYCLTNREQHCKKAKNHLHHRDGSFQEYCVLDVNYLTVLPQDVDPRTIGPVLCAGATTYKACINAELKPKQWLVVIGAGGGLGHFAVQFGQAYGAKVIGVDSGKAKKQFIESLGAQYVDFTTTDDLVGEIHKITDGGAHAVIVTTGHPKAYIHSVNMLRIGGTLCCCGLPPGDVLFPNSISKLAVHGLKFKGNLIGSLSETLEAVDVVRAGRVKPHVRVMDFRDLPQVYEMLERGDVPGRIVLQIAKDQD